MTGAAPARPRKVPGKAFAGSQRNPKTDFSILLLAGLKKSRKREQNKDQRLRSPRPKRDSPSLTPQKNSAFFDFQFAMFL
jgi:hypothetical protein